MRRREWFKSIAAIAGSRFLPLWAVHAIQIVGRTIYVNRTLVLPRDAAILQRAVNQAARFTP